MIYAIFIFAAILLQPYGHSFPYSENSDIIDVKKTVSRLNSIKGRTWTAASNNFGDHVSESYLKSQMGFSLSLNDVFSNPFTNDGDTRATPLAANEITNLESDHIFHEDDLPDNYDTRTMFPHCTTIPFIRHQSICGSCWAVSTASAFSDRLCIHSGGRINVNISANHLITCSLGGKLNGCHGGQMKEAWDYIKEHGLVTGGEYGTFEGCQPFEIGPCNKDSNAWFLMPCSTKNGDVLTPRCRRNTCTNEWYKFEQEQPYKTKSTFELIGNETHPIDEKLIRQEIYRNGPVTAAIVVFEEFYFYESGIFQMKMKDLAEAEGGHALRIVGWGVRNKIPYWIAANSWGKRWGNKGMVRILRGKNTIGIELYIHGGIPDIPSRIH